MQKATTAKENSDRSQIQERINLAYHSSLIAGKGEVTDTSLESELKKEFNKTTLDEGWLDKTSVSGKWRITIDNVYLDVPTGKNDNNDNNNITIKVGTTNLKEVSDLTTLYGETTDYKSTSHPSIDWQLFYSDTNNIYLIASDYVPNTELPCDEVTIGSQTFGTSDLQSVNGTDYIARFASTSSNNDYVMTSAAHSSGTESTAITDNPLTSTYLKWVQYADTNGYAKNNANIKAVAYMMDTSKWSSFADGVDGAYAIGGPTIEMLSLSWNAVSGHTQMTSYSTLSSNNANQNGYISISPETELNFFGTETNMWFIKESTNSYGYWLASPSSLDAECLKYVDFFGCIIDYGVSTIYGGFRPVVLISKSSLK